MAKGERKIALMIAIKKEKSERINESGKKRKD
jgi:hypothetical protein